MVRLCPLQGDGAFDFAVDDQIFTAGKLAFYHDGFADGGDVVCRAELRCEPVRPDAGGAGVTGIDGEAGRTGLVRGVCTRLPSASTCV